MKRGDHLANGRRFHRCLVEKHGTDRSPKVLMCPFAARQIDMAQAFNPTALSRFESGD